MTAHAPVEDMPLVALDANAFDRIAPGRDDLAREFHRLLDERRLRLIVLTGVAAEVAHPDVPPDIRSALQAALQAQIQVATCLPRRRASVRQEIDRIRVRAILRGDGRPGKHDDDAAHLSDAAEAGCSFFVTQDGKILRKRDTLGAALPAGLRIATLAELIEIFASDDQGLTLASDVAAGEDDID